MIAILDYVWQNWMAIGVVLFILVLIGNARPDNRGDGFTPWTEEDQRRWEADFVQPWEG